MNLDTGNAVDRQMAMLDELRRTERQVAISYIASLIVHSVGTPLNVIVGRAGMIHRDPNSTEVVAGNAKSIEQKVEQLARKLRSLIELLSPPESDSTACDSDVLVNDTLCLYGPVARTRGVALKTSVETNLMRIVNGSLAFVVLSSLVSLAVHDVEPGSAIEILVQSSNDEVANRPGPEFIHFQLSFPGCILPDPRTLERFEIPPSFDAQYVDRMEVLAMCLATVRRVGGKLEVQNNSQNLALISLLWPTVG